jgi:hypothetical protein
MMESSDSPIPPEIANKINKVGRFVGSCAPLMFVLIGFFIFMSGFPSLLKNINLFFWGVHTTAQVVEIGTPSELAPLFEFTDLSGENIRYRPNLSTDMVAYQEGQRVELIYLANKTHIAALNDVYNLWIFPLIFTAMGGLFLGFGGLKVHRIWRGETTAEMKPVVKLSFNKDILKKNAPLHSFSVFLLFGLAFFGIGIAIAFNEYQLFLGENSLSFSGQSMIDFLSDKRSGALFISAFSLIFIGIGLTQIIRGLLRKKRDEMLKSLGYKVTATVAGLDYTNTSINKVRGREIRVETGGMEFFSQPYFIHNLEKFIHKGDVVDVYLDSADRNKYFVDVESLRSD